MNTTRNKILHKAFILFLLHGYDGMSMIKLQEGTGLSRGALYHHFKSKDQLFNEVIETYYIHIPTTTNQQLKVNSLYEFYQGYFEHTIRFFKVLREGMKDIQPDNTYSFLTLGIDAMKKYSGFRDKIRNINSEVRKIWTYVVKSARENGEIQSNMSDAQIADCFIYLSEGIGTRFTIEGRAIDAGDELIQLWNGFYNEIRSKDIKEPE